MERRSMKIALLILVMATPYLIIPSVYGAETRTATLNPLADSYVDSESPNSNFGGSSTLSVLGYNSTSKCIEAGTFTVYPLSYESYGLYGAKKDEWIKGSFQVTAGGNLDIEFYFMDKANFDKYKGGQPFDYIIYAKRVTTYELATTIPKEDTYYLVFDNTFSIITSKTISLSDVWSTKIYTEIPFFMFDLSSIPLGATINAATLRVYAYYVGETQKVNAVRCTNITWKETELNYNNAPFKDLVWLQTPWQPPSATLSEAYKYYNWTITDEVKAARQTGKLTMILMVLPYVTTYHSVGLYSKEGSDKPVLEISYTYASVSLSLSSTSITQGETLTLSASTDPQQTAGTLKLQYSLDGNTWLDITSISGGSASYPWNPPKTGTIYFKASWTITWEDESYTATSNTKTLHVSSPQPLGDLFTIILIVAVVCAIAAIVTVAAYKTKAKRKTET